MDTTLRWFANYLHEKHRLKSGESQWGNCDYYPCHQLRAAVLVGIPEPHVEADGAGTY